MDFVGKEEELGVGWEWGVDLEKLEGEIGRENDQNMFYMCVKLLRQ